MNLIGRDTRLDARNAFAATKPAEQKHVGDLQALSHSGTALRITYRERNLEVTALSGEPDAIVSR